MTRLQELLGQARRAIQWSQPLVVRTTPCSRCMSTVGRPGSELQSGSVQEKMDQKEGFSEAPKLSRAVGMLESRTDSPFLGNVPLCMLGLDELSSRYRAVSFLRWEDVVLDLNFKQWYLPVETGLGEGETEEPLHSSEEHARELSGSTPRPGRRRQGARCPPAAPHICQQQQQSGTPAVADNQGMSAQPIHDSQGPPSKPPFLSWRSQGRRGPQGRALPLRCLSRPPPSPPGPVGGPSNSNSSWASSNANGTVVLDPPQLESDEDEFSVRQSDVDMLVFPVEAMMDGLPEQAQEAVVHWVVQRAQAEIEGDEDGEELSAVPKGMVGPGVPFSTQPERGSLVFHYWAKAPLG